MKKARKTYLYITAVLFLLAAYRPSYGQDVTGPLEILKKREMKLKGSRGEVYLGIIMTLEYPPYGVEPDEKYYPVLLELTDILKSPLRKGYRLVLRGFADEGETAADNLGLSRERVENLEELLVGNPSMSMKRERIKTECRGRKEQDGSRKTPGDRGINRCVEIHVYGDVSEAVRFAYEEEEPR